MPARGERANDPVGSHQGHDALAAQVEGIVEPRQGGRIKRYRNHAGECPILADHASSELDGRFLGNPQGDRLADDQPIVGGRSLDAIMLAIAQIDRARDWPKTGGDQIAGLAMMASWKVEWIRNSPPCDHRVMSNWSGARM